MFNVTRSGRRHKHIFGLLRGSCISPPFNGCPGDFFHDVYKATCIQTEAGKLTVFIPGSSVAGDW